MRKIRTRLLDLGLGKTRSAFLWGPRRVGKSHWPEVAIECKSSTRIHDGDLRGLRALAEEHRVGRRILVSQERTTRRLEDGIEVVPWRAFLGRLWAGELVT